jgi:hypothetical protein
MNWEDLEGSGHGITEVLSWHLPGRAEENQKKKMKNCTQVMWCPGHDSN